MEINWKKVELEDKEIIVPRLAYDQKRCCDLCYVNVYLWSRYYKVKYAMVEDCIIFANPDNMKSTSLPYGKPEQVKIAIETLEKYYAEQGKTVAFHLVGPDQYAWLEEQYPGKFQIEYDENGGDYVYETEKLIALTGKKYHGKRNHINNFKNTYPDWSYEPITDENVEECFQMSMQWRNERGEEVENDDEMRAEVAVTMNSLRLMNELELKGGLIRADGRVVAFAIGEELNQDMFVVHIEKAYADIQGAYAIINQQFAEHVAKDYPYINREDAAGVENLMKAKQSYHPVFMMKKGYVTLR